MANFLVLIIMALGSSGGLNEILDATDPQAYFEAQGIEMKVETLSAILAEPTKEDAEAKGQEVKKLLAMKALGGMKDKAAIPALKKAAGSDLLFFKDYAEEAIAAIEGKPYKAPSSSEADFEKDLALLPENLGAVMQLRISADGKIDVKKMVTEGLKAMPDAPDPKEMLKELNAMLTGFAGEIGNVRIDGVTFGLSDVVSDDNGFAAFIVRGLYDHKAVTGALTAMADPEKHMIGGLEFLAMDDSVAIAPVSNNLFIFVGGAGWEELPLKELAANVKTPPAAPKYSKDLAPIVTKAKKAGSMWGAMVVTDSYKELPQLKPFDSAVLSTRKLPNKENKSLITLEGTGQDEKAMGEVIQEMKAAVKEGIAEVEAEGPALEPIAKLMKSMKFYSMGQNGAISVEVDGDPASAAAGMLPMFLMGVRSVAPVPLEEGLELEVAPDVEKREE